MVFVIALTVAAPLAAVAPASAAFASPWSVPLPLPTFSDSVMEFDAAISPDGDIMVAWIETSGPNLRVFTSRFSSLSGWGPAQIADEGMPSGTNAAEVAVGMDSSGNAWVVWTEAASWGHAVRARQHLVGWGWQPAANLTPAAGGYYLDLHAAVGANGRAVAAWTSFVSSRWNLMVSSGGAGTAWFPGSLIEFWSGDVLGLDVGVDGKGLATLAWRQVDIVSGNATIYLRRSVGGGAWSGEWTPGTKEPATDNPTVAADARGTTVVAFPLLQGGHAVPQAVLVTSSGVGAMEALSSSTADAGDVQAAFDGNGRGFVMWRELAGSFIMPFASEYRPGAGWQAPLRIATTSDHAWGLAIAAGPGGVVATWTEGLTTAATAYAASWESAYGWSRAWDLKPAGEAGGGVGAIPMVARSAVVVWRLDDVVIRTLWASTAIWPDTWAPTVVVTAPALGAVREVPLVEVAGYTEPGASVAVAGVAASVATDGTFRATAPLAPGQNYLTVTATDSAGNQGSAYVFAYYYDSAYLAEAERANAGVARWQEPVELPQAGMMFSNVQLAVGPDGRAFAMWYGWDTARLSVYASRYVPGQGWEVPRALEESTEMAYWMSSDVGVDGNGDAYFVWTQFSSYSGPGSVWWATYLDGEGWSGAARIDTQSSHWAQEPNLDVNEDGDGVVTWIEFENSSGSPGRIWARPWDANEGLGSAQLISASLDSRRGPRVSVDADGDAMAAWPSVNGTTLAVQAARYVRDVGWDAAQEVRGGIGDAALADVTQVALDAEPGGGVVAAWGEHPGTYVPDANGSLWAAVYAPGTGWSAAELLDDVAGDETPQPVIAVDDRGGAVVAWTRLDWIEGNEHVWYSNLVPGSGWSAPAEAAPPGMTAESPSVAVTDGGKALLGWSEYDPIAEGQYNVSARWYDPAAGWSSPETALSDAWSPGDQFQAGFDAGGNATALWVSGSGYTAKLTVSRWMVPDTQAPALSVAFPDEPVGQSPGHITGTTEAGAVVTVNGQMVVVGPGGSFEATVPLVNGTNTVVVVARDAAGNEARAQADIVFADPAAARIAELELQRELMWVAIATQNTTLLAQLAEQDASLLGAVDALNTSLKARMDANDGALGDDMTEGDAALQQQVQSAKDSAGSAWTVALLGLVLGAGGVATGALSFLRKRKGPPLSA